MQNKKMWLKINFEYGWLSMSIIKAFISYLSYCDKFDKKRENATFKNLISGQNFRLTKSWQFNFKHHYKLLSLFNLW